MKKFFTSYLPLIAAVVLAIVLIFISLENKKLQDQNRALKEESNKLNKQLGLLNHYESTDSLLLLEDYRTAVNSIQNNYRDSIPESLLKRIKLVRKFQSLQNQLIQIKKDTATKSTDSSKAVVYVEKKAPDEAIDSMVFLLDKARYRIESLKKQIQERSYGEYLEFESSKGSKIYYVGNVKDDQANGKGVALFETGSRYNGEWKNNKRHGKGSFYWPDGEYYIGTFKNDDKSGTGTYYWPNGDKYTGEWSEDERNGKGTFYNKKGEIIAEGVWKDDEFVNKK